METYKLPDVDDAVLAVLELYPSDPESYRLYSVTYIDAHRTPEVHLLTKQEIFDKYKVKVV